MHLAQPFQTRSDPSLAATIWQMVSKPDAANDRRQSALSLTAQNAWRGEIEDRLRAILPSSSKFTSKENYHACFLSKEF